MAGIFISYRRDDSQGFAGRLADDLTEILGADLVFRDVEIPVGHDFNLILNRAIAACDVLLVVIGRDWQTTSHNGARSRLFEPTDWVRTEIKAAFEQGKHIIPILVGGAKMSTATELPEDISQLSKIQAFEMSDRRWDEDIDNLVQLLQREVPELASSVSSRHRPADSPAQVLRELGHQVLDEVRQQRTPQAPSRRTAHRRWLRPVMAIGGFLRKLVTTVFVIAMVYIGFRLFGDTAVLEQLNRLEARLLVGWDRLLGYLNIQ
ncbi:MAG: toll/interleukin-1 receptor domain-containing protein [Candidatus Thiodiazotropha sp.]